MNATNATKNCFLLNADMQGKHVAAGNWDRYEEEASWGDLDGVLEYKSYMAQLNDGEQFYEVQFPGFTNDWAMH